MSSRKPHRKSRTGCLSCKSRHIKCGEEHPICTNCTEFELVCEYSLPSSNKKPPNSPHHCSCRLPSAASRFQSRSVSEDRNTRPGSIQSSSPGSSEEADINTSDLELLHHFSTSTYLTMSNVPSEQKIWQTTIVTLGLQHKFLLRGILALSALHLAYLKPGPASIDYMVKASTHQNIGLSNFRKALQKINAETFDAILAFSCLLPIHSITIAAFFTRGAAIPEQEQDVIAAFLGALSLLRSVNSLLLPSLDVYTSSTITPLLQVTTQKLPEQPMTYPGLESLQRLEIACSVFSTSTSLSTAYAEREVFIEAIALLRSTFATTVDTESTDRFTIGAELIWTITVSDEYFGLLGRGHPSALAILAHFAVLLHRHDNVWWLQGLGKGVIERVAEVLGGEWAEVVRWPRIAAGLTT